jgi:hypothetical protein
MVIISSSNRCHHATCAGHLRLDYLSVSLLQDAGVLPRELAKLRASQPRSELSLRVRHQAHACRGYNRRGPAQVQALADIRLAQVCLMIKKWARIAPLGNDTYKLYTIHTYTLSRCAFRPGHIKTWHHDATTAAGTFTISQQT